MWSEKRRCWAGDEGSAGDGGPGRAVVGGGRKKGCVCLQPLAVAGESWLRVKVINVQLITLERKRTHTHIAVALRLAQGNTCAKFPESLSLDGTHIYIYIGFA